MQPVINTNDYPDLYRLLMALVEETSQLKHQLRYSSAPPETRSVIIWAPGEHSEILDEPAKLEMIEKYARRLGVEIVLSAAANLELRAWGHELGWTVMWDVPSLDEALANEQALQQDQWQSKYG